MGFPEAMLALLAEGPKHGYQLKLDFEGATGEAWPVNVGQVYTTLHRLERDGHVGVETTDDEGRVIYRITAEGSQALTRWIEEPVSRQLTRRDEVSMKLLLVIRAGVADPQHVIDVQRAATMTALQDYTRLRAESGADDFAWQLHIDRLAIHAEAELRWLDRVENRLDTRGVSASEDRPAGQEVHT